MTRSGISNNVFRIAVGIALAAACRSAHAQPIPRTIDPAHDLITLAANERVLWMSSAGMRDSILFRREPAAPFDLGRTVSGRIEQLAALEHGALAFFDTGALYSFRSGGTEATTEASLPGREAPVDLLVSGGELFALVSADAVRELPRWNPGAPPGAASQPFYPGKASLCIVRYDSGSWLAVAGCPPLGTSEVRGRMRPRLGRVRDGLVLLWRENPDAINIAYRGMNANEWSHDEKDLSLPGLSAFWFATAAGFPTIVATSGKAAGTASESAGEGLTAWRLLNAAALPGPNVWTKGELQLSPLPGGEAPVQYRAALAFNQHIALLAVGGDGQPLLRFARVGEPPVETTVEIAKVVDAPVAAAWKYNLFHLASFVVLALVFVGLFVFRRDSLSKPARAPAGFAVALTLQRTGAWLIDFVPFSVAASLATGAGWIEGFQTLGSWALSPDPSGPPDARVLTWWGLTAGGHTLYALVMELATGRTVGKALLGLRLASEAGATPSRAQIVGRNALRLLELLPQFWIFAALVILSRNRQRLGDIFARTIVVRRATSSEESGS